MVPISTECVITTELAMVRAGRGACLLGTNEVCAGAGQRGIGSGEGQRGPASDGWYNRREGPNCRSQSSRGKTEVCHDLSWDGSRDPGVAEGPGSSTAEHVNKRLEWGPSQAAWESESFTVMPTEEGHLHVKLTEQCDSAVAEFVVKMDCVLGRCLCVYSLCKMPCQLKPCRFFAEIFYRGGIDPDFMFILKGIVFGFNVIDPEFERCYDSCRRPGKVDWENNIIEKKLLAEIESGVISVVESPPMCVHGVFVVPKDGGGRA